MFQELCGKLKKSVIILCACDACVRHRMCLFMPVLWQARNIKPRTHNIICLHVH